MAPIRSFEEIEAWQKARELTKAIYAVSSEASFARDFALRDQIRRAAISILSNIAEGFERGGNAEFRQFLAIAKGSAGEVRAQLYVALDAHHLTHEQFTVLHQLTTEISRLLSGFLSYLEKPIIGAINSANRTSDNLEL